MQLPSINSGRGLDENRTEASQLECVFVGQLPKCPICWESITHRNSIWNHQSVCTARYRLYLHPKCDPETKAQSKGWEHHNTRPTAHLQHVLPMPKDISEEVEIHRILPWTKIWKEKHYVWDLGVDSKLIMLIDSYIDHVWFGHSLKTGPAWSSSLEVSNLNSSLPLRLALTSVCHETFLTWPVRQ